VTARRRASDERSDTGLDRLFGALADPTRRSLLARLALGPRPVTELAAPYRMSLPAVSKHLRILEEAGLVRREVNGRVHRLTLRGAPLEQVEVWLDPFRSYWAHTLGAMKRDLESRPPSPAPPTGSRRRRRAV
jgi:DNA-binding transcriptional ArsR family regulator